jgi:hypothetical protein
VKISPAHTPALLAQEQPLLGQRFQGFLKLFQGNLGLKLREEPGRQLLSGYQAR